MTVKTKREQFLDYVKNGGDRIPCSPQIGAGAGYEAKLMGKKFGEGTLGDAMAVANRYNMLPLYNVWINATSHCNPLNTAKGCLGNAGTGIPLTVNGAEDLGELENILDMAIGEKDMSCYYDLAVSSKELIGEDGPIAFQWGMLPYELLWYPNTAVNAILPYDDEPYFIRLMEKVLILDYQMMDALAPSGIEFITLGIPGAESVSPRFYDEYIIPYAKKAIDYAHEKGFMIYCHVCGHMEPMLTMGHYNQLGVDLFETISTPPEGNVVSFADALGKMDPGICTRGNVSLSSLLLGTPADIRKEVYDIMKAAEGRKHFVAASDYLMYDVPEKNVIAMCEAAEEYYR